MNDKDDLQLGEIHEGWLHADRKNHWDCGGALRYIGTVRYEWCDVPEYECVKCGQKLDATGAYDEMMRTEDYNERKRQEAENTE